MNEPGFNETGFNEPGFNEPGLSEPGLNKRIFRIRLRECKQPRLGKPPNCSRADQPLQRQVTEVAPSASNKARQLHPLMNQTAAPVSTSKCRMRIDHWLPGLRIESRTAPDVRQRTPKSESATANGEQNFSTY